MVHSEIVVRGTVFRPVYTNAQLPQHVMLKDNMGPYVACRLQNKRHSVLYGWYVLVSPADLQLMEHFNWCGRLSHYSNTVEVRRRETCDGIQRNISLAREIWAQMYTGEVPNYVFKLAHTLDFRRHNLSRISTTVDRRGVVWHSRHRCWQVQIWINAKGKMFYIGNTDHLDEGYRMFNRYLKKLKKKFPKSAEIQAMPYNKIDPMF